MEKIAYLSIGSNIGDKSENLNNCINKIKSLFSGVEISNFYLTKALNYIDQDDFYNCCVSLKTDLNPFELLKKLQNIEKEMGQGSKEVRFGPRIIDIDIVLFSDEIIKTDNLVIPHERMDERAFVLKPLLDLNENIIHPVLKKSVKELLNKENIEDQEINKI